MSVPWQDDATLGLEQGMPETSIAKPLLTGATNERDLRARERVLERSVRELEGRIRTHSYPSMIPPLNQELQQRKAELATVRARLAALTNPAFASRAYSARANR